VRCVRDLIATTACSDQYRIDPEIHLQQERARRQRLVLASSLSWDERYMTDPHWAQRLCTGGSTTIVGRGTPCRFCGQDPRELHPDVFFLTTTTTDHSVVPCCAFCHAGVSGFGASDYVRAFTAAPVRGASVAGRGGFARDYTSFGYDTYRTNAELRNVGFYVTRPQFAALRRRPCTYCGRADKHMGCDRLDNASGYSVANTVPSCFGCNRLKMNWTAADFLHKAKSLADRL
jgi:hypothetical protein